MLWEPPRELREFIMANRTFGQSDRERAATLAEIYYLSRQFEGLAEWDDKSVPLAKRKPKFVIPLYKEMVDDLDRFVWGGHRFPSAIVSPTRTDDDQATEDEIGPLLDKEQAKTLSTFLAAAIRQGRIDRRTREAASKAIITTSAAAILGIADGYLTVYVEPGKHCTPTFCANGRDVESIEILYQYEKQVPYIGATTRPVPYWYRRTITEERDVVYVEVPVVPGQDPKWVEDDEKSVDHALGFCPVRWFRTLPDCADPIDGRPVIDPALYPLLDDISRIASQKSRAVTYGCDPQVVRIGVNEADRETLQKSAGKAWDLPEGGDAKLIEATGTGATRAAEHLREMERAVRDAVGVVKASPEVLAGKVTGIVLEMLHRPMVSLASDLRADLGEDGYCGLLNLVLRMCCVVHERGEDVWIPGVADAVDILQQAQLAGMWLDVPITLKWPEFFVPGSDEQQQIVAATVSAAQSGFISKLTATRHLADMFGVEDAEAEHETIDDETDKETSREGASLMMPGGVKPPTDPSMDDGFEGTEAVDAVYQQLADDFEPDAIEWVRSAKWEGPMDVPLDEIDYSQKASWRANGNKAKVNKFVKKIKAGDKKPIVLIKPPGGGKYRVADGHHRALAYQQSGKPARAYVATVDKAAFAAAMEMHSSQKVQS